MVGVGIGVSDWVRVVDGPAVVVLVRFGGVTALTRRFASGRVVVEGFAAAVGGGVAEDVDEGVGGIRVAAFAQQVVAGVVEAVVDVGLEHGGDLGAELGEVGPHQARSAVVVGEPVGAAVLVDAAAAGAVGAGGGVAALARLALQLGDRADLGQLQQVRLGGGVDGGGVGDVAGLHRGEVAGAGAAVEVGEPGLLAGGVELAMGVGVGQAEGVGHGVGGRA